MGKSAREQLRSGTEQDADPVRESHQAARPDPAGPSAVLAAPILAAGNAAVARLVGRAGEGGQGAGPLDPGIAAAIDSARGGGSPLGESVGADMGSRFGADFSSVRIHTDAAADTLSRSVSATAFTAGSDIFFSQGTYAPGSSAGTELLAHELTHVVQHSSGGAAGAGDRVSHPDDTAEVQARNVARSVLRDGGAAAGNQVVARELSGAASGGGTIGRSTGTGGIHRFVGSEHKELGDTTDRTIDLGNGVVLSWGDVVALAGDEYASPEDLMNDTRDDAGKLRLRAAIKHDGIASAAFGSLGTPANADAEKALDSDRTFKFLALAAENSSHFNADGSAVDRWRSGHSTALLGALEAGMRGDAATRNLADFTEAFAQHFLTDSFSGGHIRVPRADILGWYRTHFAPTVTDVFLTMLKAHLVDGLAQQISPQTPWYATDGAIHNRVSDAVGPMMDQAIAKIGGHEALVNYFAEAVAGAVSGSLHDLEGGRGVMVTSDAHPEPWRAFGDDKLADSPVSRDQAQQAVATATAQLDRAFMIGEKFRRDGDINAAIAVTYFNFDSAALEAGASAEVAGVGRYLHLHPETQVTLVGHTDPLGTDDYNLDLGRRRANTVAQQLTAASASPDQIAAVQSRGEQDLVSAVPSGYKFDRRVDFLYASRMGSFDDPLQNDALARLQGELPPPYTEVTQYVPHPVATPASSPADQNSTSAGTQVELEDWHWGSIPPNLRSEINTWVRGKAGLIPDLATVEELKPRDIEGYHVEPQPIVQELLNALMADPAAFLEGMFGRQMSR